MKSSGTKILIVGLTALCLSAGVVAGMLVSRLPAAGSTPDSAVPARSALMTPLVEELNLDADQQVKMRGIWEGVRTQVQQSYEDASKLQTSRDNAIAGILTTDEQKAKFEKIAHDYHNQYLEISHKRDQTINEAIAHTKALLTPEQQTKYDEELKIRLGHLPTTMPSPLH